MGKLVHLKKTLNQVEGLGEVQSMRNPINEEQNANYSIANNDQISHNNGEKVNENPISSGPAGFEAEMSKFFQKQIIGLSQSFETPPSEQTHEESEPALLNLDRLKIFNWPWVKHILSIFRKALLGKMKQLKCSDCQAQFFIDTDLTVHMWNCMAGKKPYKCGHCEKRFKYYFGMAGHMEVHSNTEKETLLKEIPIVSPNQQEESTEIPSDLSNQDSQSSDTTGHENERICESNTSIIENERICESNTSIIENERISESNTSIIENERISESNTSIIDETHLKNDSTLSEDLSQTDSRSNKPGLYKGMYCCKLCGQLFYRKKYFLQHKEYHRIEKKPSYKCSFCKVWFSSQDMTKHHESQVHPVEYHNFDISKPTPDSNALCFLFSEISKWHDRSIDNVTIKCAKKEKRFECFVCLRKFTTKHFVEKHQLRDHNELMRLLVAINHLLCLTVRKPSNLDLIPLLSQLDKKDILNKLEELSNLDVDFLDNFQHVQGGFVDESFPLSHDEVDYTTPNPNLQNIESPMEISIQTDCMQQNINENLNIKLEIKDEPSDDFNQENHDDLLLAAKASEMNAVTEISDARGLENIINDLTGRKQVYNEENMIECPICRKKLSPKSNMKIHLLTHTGVKNYECPYCHQKYTLQSTLKRHIRTHTGDKPFICSFCNKSYSQSTNLKRHIRIHTGFRPFKCHLCPKNYCDRFSLTRHIRTHE